MKIVWIVLLSCIVNVAVASDLKPFTSDGCSVFPDGTLKEKDLWLSCCIEHDRAYWLGGTHKEKNVLMLDLKNMLSVLVSLLLRP